MKKLMKLVVLLSALFTISNAYSAELPPSANITKAFADSAKRSILGEGGEFPVKVDAGYEITNIFGNLNNIVFEYNMPTDSQSVSIVDITENIRLGLNAQFCNKQDVIEVLRAYDIRFLFRFQFNDDRNVPATLSIDEICKEQK
ncbi:MAG: hypothetical protein J6569_05625 [Gilliamella sp.]|uniref:hypothetical protein n=1 Tax=unclassified Gilliamella TaxID=2685620 RepID=UPI00080E448D|nr:MULTISPECIES: hypothetical protein [Gilliamella]MCO6537738.1 hypothetical protein [Gilliamella sp.]MCO6539597.1 hypothetical protein [Gilliamella sp.]MCO6553523.1 hypothetical protein [Gilliamella sp.]MCO6556987.1 hypothetical protein [Gilliamella sp.]NUE95071.1 hypothetical protein [Gilliamella sp. ESL0232]